MSTIRLHLPGPLIEGGLIDLPAEQAHYLLNVMRRAAGDEVLAFNQTDGEWRGLIEPAGKRGARLRLSVRTRAPEPVADLDLCIALVKRARLETIIEKAAELGCARVRLMITQHTQAEAARLDRLAAIAAEASEQTGRLSVPQILPPQKLGAMLGDWKAETRPIFCDERAGAQPMLDALSGLRPAPAAIFIGPEGGFSVEEAAWLRALPGAVRVSLGPRILRADTAAIVALALYQTALGDWRGG